MLAGSLHQTDVRSHDSSSASGTSSGHAAWVGCVADLLVV